MSLKSLHYFWDISVWTNVGDRPSKPTYTAIPQSQVTNTAESEKVKPEKENNYKFVN